MTRNRVAETTDEVVETTAMPVEVIEEDSYGSVAYAPAPFIPINELLKPAHFANIPWARPLSIPFENKPTNHALWTGNSLCRLTVLMPKDCWFTSKAFVSQLSTVEYTVTSYTFEQAEIEVGNDKVPELRKVWHIVFRSTDSEGKTHPVGRMMWNVTEARTPNGVANVSLTGNASWGVPVGQNINLVKSYEKTLIKRALRAALNGQAKYAIRETTRTLDELFDEIFAINGNEGEDLPENLNRSVSEDAFASEDTV